MVFCFFGKCPYKGRPKRAAKTDLPTPSKLAAPPTREINKVWMMRKIKKKIFIVDSTGPLLPLIA